ncbi:hypothetical protein [Halorubrum sp. Atlit-26R]|jgi:hypothetical protein|uniref:hypothetical protein n=1 Tax=Halorubrum sp. Atlit-26R TaxID=2282128 RepID=UPI000EF25BD1|nr:hypothetical protein [Halorubrum sp. Atlit-26R]RLM68588.1 hypothetical protein DVK07_10735 [Halorubrum sp. Atlit-26R]
MALIDANHLRACREHRVVSEEWCPVCATDAEADGTYDGSVGHIDRRRAPPEDQLRDHLSEIVEAAQDVGGRVTISVAELDKKELPAGYTPQERWFNVVEIRNTDGMVEETIKSGKDLENTAEQIEAGEIDLSAPDYDHLLDPEEWRLVFRANAYEVEFERVEETRLRATAGVNSSSKHSKLRKEVGTVAERMGLSVHTRNAGDTFEDSVIDIYTDHD